MMGSVVSSNTKSRLGICLTLDAFGTLYHPKKPIAVQYLEVAEQCGLKANIQVPELEASFRNAFKSQSAKYPNYGKSKGMSVESWWGDVVHAAFRPLCRGQTMPASLASTLFHHFSSRDAYELYQDVQPFFQMMRELRQKYGDPKGPTILVGIITNSDSRARTILQSLGLQVGTDWESLSKYRDLKRAWEDAAQGKSEAEQKGRRFEGAPLSGNLLHSYRSSDDINFLVTSYATGSEKPDRKIFAQANELAAMLRVSRLEQTLADEYFGRNLGNLFEAAGLAIRGLGITRIHVGDDFEKDHQGAKNANCEALHLCRENETDDLKDYQISNLLELATAIKVMANNNLSPDSTDGN
jgi:FMN phosphatase YigB (HAD superfamily)